MNRKIFVVLFFGIMFCVTGCSGKVQISGTVKYSDGAPVTKGNVVFENADSSYFGVINNDGTYITGGNKQVEGIPKGIYKVWLAQTESSENILDENGKVVSCNTTQTVAKKFTSSETTDLTFEVKPEGQKTFNIIVEKP
ncbi:MAG: carboxypeptidase-like regulatory domain-containing protein [Planctomycetaceae bacterium]|jgi:hypothetical protein|nr:carboxypeptidase-like regulatory domain-containing protein [Planctomycetaceae bacterium]